MKITMLETNNPYTTSPAEPTAQNRQDNSLKQTVRFYEDDSVQISAGAAQQLEGPPLNPQNPPPSAADTTSLEGSSISKS